MAISTYKVFLMHKASDADACWNSYFTLLSAINLTNVDVEATVIQLPSDRQRLVKMANSLTSFIQLFPTVMNIGVSECRRMISSESKKALSMIKQR